MSDAWADLGHTEQPVKPRPKAPMARLEAVRCLGECWEAEITRPDGRHSWLYRKTEADVRQAAAEYMRRVSA